MLGNFALPITIPQLETGLEQIVDRLGKNSRRRRGDARHLVASYQQMTEAALMARLDESTVGGPSVTHQKPLVMVAQDTTDCSYPRPGRMAYTVTCALTATCIHCRRPPTFQPVSSG